MTEIDLLFDVSPCAHDRLGSMLRRLRIYLDPRRAWQRGTHIAPLTGVLSEAIAIGLIALIRVVALAGAAKANAG